MEEVIFRRFLPFPFLDELPNPRIRTGTVIRRIAQRQNILVLPNGKALNLPEFRIAEFLAQFLSKISPPFRIIGKCFPKTGNRLAIDSHDLFLKKFSAAIRSLRIFRLEKVIRHLSSPNLFF